MRVEQLTLFDMPANNKKVACLSIGDFAKILSSRNIKTGEVRLFKKLRCFKLLDSFNVPYQKYIDKGYFKVIRERYYVGNVPHTFLKVLVTPSGQEYIEERLRNEANGNWS